MSDDLKGELKIVQFGIDVESFLQSAIGKFLTNRAESERTIMLEQLVIVDPEDAKAIRSLQHDIGVVDAIQQWLADAIEEGNSTAEAIEQAETQTDQQP
jgi:hypothetical protein